MRKEKSRELDAYNRIFPNKNTKYRSHHKESDPKYAIKITFTAKPGVEYHLKADPFEDKFDLTWIKDEDGYVLSFYRAPKSTLN